MTKRAVLQLADGPHQIKAPSFFVLQYLAEHGFNVSEGVDPSDPRFVAAALAALLSDSEPTGPDGEPVKVWSPAAASKLVPLTGLEKIGDVIAEFMFSDGDGAGEPLAE